MIRFCIHFLLVAMISVTVGSVAYKIDKIRPDNELQSFLYLAKNNKVQSFAFGFETAYADILWMLSIQAFHKHCIDKIPFSEAKQVYKSIARLDPHFKGMYEIAAIYIAMVEKKSLPALQFLEESLHQEMSIGVKYPEKEQLINQAWMWYLLGRVYCLQRHELLKKDKIPIAETMKNAIRCMNQCLKLSNGQHAGAQFFARFLVKSDQGFTFDIITWLQVYERSKENELLKKLVLEKIRELIAEIHVTNISENITVFKETHEGLPKNLQEIMKYKITEPSIEDMPKILTRLVAIISQTVRSEGIRKVKEKIYKYINQKLSTEFPSSSFYFIHENKIISLIQADKKCKRLLVTMDILINRFMKKIGRYPENINELVTKGYLSKIPNLPLARKFVYDSATGKIDWK